MSARIRQHRARRPNLKLKSLRINAGLSRADLEARTGVSRESIRLAEAGFVPGPRIQFALAESFRMLPLDIWPLEHQPLSVAA